ncbi:MAG TPA: 3'-5' exonuclease, partial [Spirochaetia bacterium]|nr:3'-5' exonuclease [Spirochaetia bacterium]
ILLRSTGNQIIYERSFRQSGIPYNAVDVRTLFLEAPVADIYNILQIAVHPEDRLAYAGYLRSPFVNLDDQAFVDILKLNTEAFAEPPSAIESLASEQLLRYQRGRELFLEVKENARGSSIRELVTHLWYRAGYRYTILKEKRYAGYIDYFSYLIEIASTYDSTGKPLPVFLEFLRENLGKYERLPEISILKEEERGVKIMTIHKAKGLEFPVVICANAGNAGRKGEEISAPYYVSDEFGISFNLIRNPKTGKRSNYIYSLSKEEDDAKTLAEAKRLLYVTLTRAQNHLIISGCHTKMNRNNPGTFLNMVLRSLGWDGKSSPLESKELSSYIEEIPDIKREEIFARMRHENPADLRARARDYAGGRLISFSPMRTEYSVTELCTLATQSEVPSSGTVRELSLLPSDAVAGEDTEAAFGTLCHYVIEKMLLRTYRRDGIPDSLRRPFDEKDYPLFLSDAERLATGFLESDLGREAAADSSRRTELAFVSRYGTDEEPGYVSGKIDLLFRRGEEAVVVDFKSSRAIVPHEYDVQLTVYRKAARDLTGLPVRTIIFYLRSGESLEVDETIDIEALIRTNRESMIDT